MRKDFASSLAKQEPWREKLIIYKGKPAACLANCINVLENHDSWVGVLEYNEFANHVCARHLPPAFTHAPVPKWDDQHDRLAAAWIQNEVEILASDRLMGAAVQTVARKRSFNPVRDYLDGLEWDGKPRIGCWLHTYLGVECNPYSQAVGACWLISAVARIYRPGAKVDTALILEGIQGKGKSTALRYLCRNEEWFTDNIDTLGSKDAKMQSWGVWIAELGELSSMSRSEKEQVKAYMSAKVDRFRPPFGRHVVEYPRQCVYAGTTNRETYLDDETGNRRWWPVTCHGTIQLDAIARDRDQLWAEAVAQYRDGAVWWLDEEIQAQADAETKERLQADVWGDVIENWLDGHGKTDGVPWEQRDDTSVTEILKDCLDKDTDKWTKADMDRVARVLKTSGWERYRLGVRSNREWRYKRSKSTDKEIE